MRQRSDTSYRKPPKPSDGSPYKPDWKKYGVLATSVSQRKALWERDHGICCKCLLDVGQLFEAEHSFPLHLVDRSDYPNCLRYWSISNLETICPKCHKPKSAKERKENAKTKRMARKWATMARGEAFLKELPTQGEDHESKIYTPRRIIFKHSISKKKIPVSPWPKRPKNKGMR